MLTGIGIIGVIVGLDLRNNEALQEYDLNEAAYYGSLLLGVCMLLLVLIALALMICKNKCLSCVYGFFAFIGFGVFLAGTILIIVGKNYVVPYVQDQCADTSSDFWQIDDLYSQINTYYLCGPYCQCEADSS